VQRFQVQNSLQQEDAVFLSHQEIGLKLGLNLRTRTVQGYIRSMAVYGLETWALQKVYRKYLGSSEMWCRRRREKISWTDSVRNEVLHRVNEDRNILHTVIRREANLIGHILRRNCLLKRVIEGNIDKQLPDGFNL
jgi:hypothetical protein